MSATANSYITDETEGKRMPRTYFRTCPICSAALDPGEKCDCMTENAQRIAECALVFGWNLKRDRPEAPSAAILQVVRNTLIELQNEAPA